MGPEVVLGNATALMGTTVAVCGSLKVIAEIVACIVGALFTVGCLFKILENAGIAVLKLVLKVMELAVETVPVITVAVAVVLEFVETGTAPLAEAIGGMVAVIDVGVEIALSFMLASTPQAAASQRPISSVRYSWMVRSLLELDCATDVTETAAVNIQTVRTAASMRISFFKIITPLFSFLDVSLIGSRNCLI